MTETVHDGVGSPAYRVVAADGAHQASAESWAARLAAWERSAGRPSPDPGPAGALVLEVGPAGLTLVTRSGQRVTAAAPRLAGKALPGRDLLARAALTGRQGGPPAVVDATAGLGADGFHLAALGHEVLMLEREPLFAALLADTLERARSGALGEAGARAAGRVTLLVADARGHLATAPGSEVVYLDPMFPGRGGAALTGKGMSLFRAGLAMGEDERAEEDAELLAAARGNATRRVIVKRPLKAPPLGGVAPSGSLRGSTVRYDLYAPGPRPAEARQEGETT